MGKAITTVIVWLLLGAGLTVVTAWGCSLAQLVLPEPRWSRGLQAGGSSTGVRPPVSANGRAQWDAVFGRSIFFDTWEDMEAWQQDLQQRDPAADGIPSSPQLGNLVFILRENRASGHGMERVLLSDEIRSRPMDLLIVRAGWPMRAVQMEWITQNLSGRGPTRHQGGFAARWAWGGGPGSQRIDLPWRPMWPGFAINTLFHAAMAWLFFAALVALRRRILVARRIKRGLCPRCAYPVGISDKCTECGAAVRLLHAR